MLVLAANPGPEAGTDHIDHSKTVGSFPIPLVIVSGGLTDAEIDGLS